MQIVFVNDNDQTMVIGVNGRTKAILDSSEKISLDIKSENTEISFKFESAPVQHSKIKESTQVSTKPTDRPPTKTKEWRERRPVIQLDSNGNEIKTFDSVRQASAAVGCYWTDIIKQLRGKREEAGGFKWKYASGDVAPIGASVPVTKVRRKGGQPVLQFSHDGKTFIRQYPSQTIAAKAHQLSNSSINKAITGNFRAGGFYWRRASIK